MAEWEKKIGSPLCPEMMKSWSQANLIDQAKLKRLIIEFRDRMLANGTEYADFVAAFKDWLRRGFLSLTIQQIRTTTVTHGRHEDHSNGKLKL